MTGFMHWLNLPFTWTNGSVLFLCAWAVLVTFKHRFITITATSEKGSTDSGYVPWDDPSL